MLWADRWLFPIECHFALGRNRLAIGGDVLLLSNPANNWQSLFFVL
jgi:hypothetical protein